MATAIKIFSANENLSASRGTEWREYTAGTNSGATASHAAASGVVHKVCGATFYSDKNSIISILSGTTVIWEGSILTAVNTTVHVTFPEPLQGTISELVSAVVASSTADCSATIWGFSDKTT